ncbi:MAG TPA: pyridoxal-phosphate dependent enzyme, partial [Candidatus Limnocylindrales bacterium]|nr:pyridoxal-phosphate dependent enzyme [Candidatus Limnocylindrales bacterium]
MRRLGLERDIVDPGVRDRAADRCRSLGVRLPTFAELADPDTIPSDITASLASVAPDAPDARNLFRSHWFNDTSRAGLTAVPEHLVLPESLTGVRSPIVIALGDRFPMIGSHKVIAAYACLAPRIVTGQFDPASQRAIWPSTGNYCRGGVAISRIMGCRGVAVLPTGMSRERFEWLERWVADPADIIRTPGTESNVKEIYDTCAELDREPDAVIFNQFSEFANHVAHYAITGRALERVFEHVALGRPGARAAAFVSATGSAGTIGAGDYLKERLGSRTVAVEAAECPTMLAGGFGEHNIQGIGDKHIPLIHNVMNTDYAVAISDHGTDALNVLFNSDEGRRYLSGRRGVPSEMIDRLGDLGVSSICNILGAVKLAKYLGLGEDDVVVTVATDGAEMYATELQKTMQRD